MSIKGSRIILGTKNWSTYEFESESTRFLRVADDVHVPKIAKGILVLLVLQVGKELSVLAESHCPEFGDLGDD